jgi:hypothetical protein
MGNNRKITDVIHWSDKKPIKKRRYQLGNSPQASASFLDYAKTSFYRISASNIQFSLLIDLLAHIQGLKLGFEHNYKDVKQENINNSKYSRKKNT